MRADPRPLVGEPVGVDLLNTVWRDAGGEHDLLATPEGVDVWLRAQPDTTWDADRPAATEATRLALVSARGVLHRHAAGLLAPPVPEPVVAELNALLARGGLSRSLGPHGPRTRAAVADADWLAAWTAAEGYLRLLEQDPGRLRRCAHPDCVLHFYDTSKRGDRRWCSMAGCGNRAKAARHYARSRSG